MMAGKQLRDLFGMTYWTICKNLEQIDHEASLQRTEPAGKSINWIVGHILQNRDRMLALLGKEPVWAEDESSRYARGTPTLEPAERAVQLERMIGLLEASQERLLSALDDERILSKKTGEDTLAHDVFIFNFHESYHAGQLGILRRILGKEGAIP